MNCKEAQDLLMDYMEGTLDESTQKAVEEQIAQCKVCKEAYEALLILFREMDSYEEKTPDSSLEKSFYAMLHAEQERVSEVQNSVSGKSRKLFRKVFQVAAVILMLVGSYFLGIQNARQSSHQELAMMKEQVTHALLESRSASKRIQAVNYTRELEETNEQTLQVLIELMQHDKHVNVRLAAADALAHFNQKEMSRKALIDQLKVENNPNMQIELIQILIDLQEDSVLPTMREMLENEEISSFIKEQIQFQLGQNI